MAMIEVLGVEHVELTVNDLERSTAFYERVLTTLGFKRLAIDGYIGWANTHVTVAIHAATVEPGAPFTRYRVGLHHLAFRANSRDAIDAFHEFLLHEGIAVLDAPATYPQYGENYYAVFFADPDGMKIELAHFPWGYWRRAQINGHDERPRYESRSTE